MQNNNDIPKKDVPYYDVDEHSNLVNGAEISGSAPDSIDENLAESNQEKNDYLSSQEIKLSQLSKDSRQSKQRKQKNKKKKKTDAEKKFSSLIAISVVVAIACGGLGMVGGWFLYENFFKPEEVFVSESGNLSGLEQRAEGKDLFKEFEKDPHNLVNLAQIKFARKKTTLVLAYNEATNPTGTQRTSSATINTSSRTFNQNISSTNPESSIQINTAFRFYDEHDGKISAFEEKFPKDWNSNLSPKTYTYDKYIDTFGKIHQGLYILDADGKYVTSDTTQKIEGGNWISGVSIFQITDNNVVSKQFQDNGDKTYTINLELEPKSACSFYAAQIKTNGGLQKNPRFSKNVKVSYVIDENCELISGSAWETYDITKGVPVTVECEESYKYFSSDDENLTVNGIDVQIPSMDETFKLAIDLKGEFIK